MRRWHARMLLDRASPVDRDQAGAFLIEARTAYQQLGMPRHVVMADQMLR